MPDEDRRQKPPKRALSLGTLLLALIAAAFGYLFASRLGEMTSHRDGAVRRFFVMNTEAVITIPAENGGRLPPEELADIAEEAVREVNRLMSPVGEDSDVFRLNRAGAGEWVAVAPLTWTVAMEALRWHRLSGGAFDPTIGPLKRLFTFDRREALAWPSADSLAEARDKVGADKLDFRREGMLLAWRRDGMRLDLGAIAKGFGVDRAIEALQQNGVVNAIVEVGGEVRSIGKKPGPVLPSPWNAGIMNPRGAGAIVIANISDKALATSGDYANFFLYRGKRYEHIIDPRKGLPLADGLASVTVIHPDSCMMADALATTLSVLGPKDSREFLQEQALGLFANGVEAIMLRVEDDGSVVRIDFKIDERGVFSENTSAPEFIVFDGDVSEARREGPEEEEAADAE